MCDVPGAGLHVLAFWRTGADGCGCAVVTQQYSVNVMDEHVLRGNTAIIKCHIPSFVADYVTVASWVQGAQDGQHEIREDYAYGNICICRLQLPFGKDESKESKDRVHAESESCSLLASSFFPFKTTFYFFFFLFFSILSGRCSAENEKPEPS